MNIANSAYLLSLTAVPHKSHALILFLTLALTVSVGKVKAYEMNPIDVDCWGVSAMCSMTELTSGMKMPVHETMTLLAYDYYLDPESAQGGEKNTSAEELQKTGVFRDLVLGSEWNDDPDSLLRQDVVRAKQWYALFKDAQLQAQCSQDISQAKCKGVKLADAPMMLYRSHFGDFQFIHAMASNQSETAQETKNKIMAWAKFTYTLSISPGGFGKEVIDGPVISAFSDVSTLLKRQGWTVAALFDPVPGGEWIRSFRPGSIGSYKPSGVPRAPVQYKNKADESSIKHIALGSLLHMIQDSYSDAHTERNGGCNPLSKERGSIISFRDYASQVDTEHAIADHYPVWLKNGKLGEDNPLWASAKVIQFSFRKIPWDGVVENFISNEIFPLDNPKSLPAPGDVNCFMGKS